MIADEGDAAVSTTSDLETAAQLLTTIASRLRQAGRQDDAKDEETRALIRELAGRLEQRRPAEPPRMMTIQRYAEAHGPISTASVRRRIADGTLKAVRIGHRVLIPVGEQTPDQK
jgi:hypothetical protein